MTEERLALLELIEKGADADLVRELLAFAAERLMEMGVEARTGVPAGVRSPDRANHRDGCRERAWETRAGRVELANLRLREGSCFPSFLEPRRTAERALAAVIQEAHVHGVSTRAVDDLVKAMGGAGISKSRFRGSSRGSMRASTRSSPARSRASGRACGSTRPTRGTATAGASSRPPSWSRSA